MRDLISEHVRFLIRFLVDFYWLSEPPEMLLPELKKAVANSLPDKIILKKLT